MSPGNDVVSPTELVLVDADVVAGMFPFEVDAFEVTRSRPATIAVADVRRPESEVRLDEDRELVDTDTSADGERVVVEDAFVVLDVDRPPLDADVIIDAD